MLSTSNSHPSSPPTLPFGLRRLKLRSLPEVRFCGGIFDTRSSSRSVGLNSLPTEANQYVTLKDTLLKRMVASEQRHFQQLLQAEELGDKKPTQLLQHML